MRKKPLPYLIDAGWTHIPPGSCCKTCMPYTITACPCTYPYRSQAFHNLRFQSALFLCFAKAAATLGILHLICELSTT